MSRKKLTQTEFINRCKNIHGEKYDYTNSVYVNSTTKFEVKCVHCNTTWMVTPINHLTNKSGCPQCKSDNNRIRNKSIFNTNWFIEISSKEHKNKFDYSQTIYIDNNHKVDIICPQHGGFSQWPSDHMRGTGCSLCSGSKVDPAKFIEKMKIKHPKFDFSKFVYTTAKTKSIVICPTHGEFLVRPNDLNFGHACNQCGIDRQQQTKIERGVIADPKDKSDYENYRRAVWRISNRNYKLYKDKINPENHPRSLKYHLDHIYPIQKGWINGKMPEEIGDWSNLQILEGILNRKKGSKIDS